MAGYIRQDTTNNIADGNVVNASDFDNEYNAIEAAFHASTGHTHDGTAAEGAPITKVGPAQDLVVGIAAITPKTDNTLDLGSSLLEFKDLYIDGTANIDSLVADTADINAGTIDGTTIGGSVAAAGTFTTATATTGNITTVNATTVDTTNLEASNIKAKDGTASMTLADATGVASFSANPVLSGGTANGVLYLNGSKVATSGSALTFDGTTITQTASTPVFGLWESASGNFNRLLITQNAGLATYNLTYSTLGTVAQIWQLGGSEQMRLTSTGLGIGTSSPDTKLTVTVADAATSTRFKAATGMVRFRPYVDATNGAIIDATNSAENAYLPLTLTGSTLQLYGNNGAGAVIDSSGNLGIGTSSPNQKFVISDAGAAGLEIGPTVVNSAPALVSYNRSGGAWTQLTYSALAHVWQGSGSEQMRLDSSGNLGLGVTPSAWGGTYKGFQIGQGGLMSRTGGSDVYLLGNNYYDGTNFRYINTSFASRYQQDSGSHAWFTAPSGTAGNAISFTQAMTLDASGNLLVGTTSAGYSAAGRGLLEVNGSSSALLALRTGDTNRGYLYTQGTDMIAWAETGNFTVGTAASAFIQFQTNNTERARITSGGNFQLTSGGQIELNVSTLSSKGAIAAFNTDSTNGGLVFKTEASGTLTERARITSGGNLLVGFTSSSGWRTSFKAETSGVVGCSLFNVTEAADYPVACVNEATSGNNQFVWFLTEAVGSSARGSIEYNRGAGLVAYNTTSDYRAKDIIGPVQNPGATIDSLKVYEGVMKGATQSRPMLIAHEAQAHAPYAVSGVKDEVNEDGTPKFQQMDVSALVPLLLAEIQSLRARVAALEAQP